MKKIKQVLNEALGVKEASQWGSPEEILQDVAQTLERDVEWPLTEIMPGPEVKQLLSPVFQAINRKMDQVSRNESVVREDMQPDDGQPYDSADDFFGQFEAGEFDREEVSDDGMEVRGYYDNGQLGMIWRYDDASKTSGWGNYADYSDNVEENINRLRQLSGLKVDEGLGYGEEQMLNKLLQEIEISINRTEGLLRRYAQQVNKMSAHMGEEDQMHYGYGVQAMIDLVDQMHQRVQKLG